jgi:hypothetical protein
MKDEVGGTCSTHEGNENFVNVFVGRDHLGNTGLDGRIILK